MELHGWRQSASTSLSPLHSVTRRDPVSTTGVIEQVPHSRWVRTAADTSLVILVEVIGFLSYKLLEFKFPACVKLLY